MSLARWPVFLCAFLCGWGANPADAGTIIPAGTVVTLDFEGRPNGDIINTDFLCSHLVRISATTDKESQPDLAIIFDSTYTVNPNDFDLQLDPGGWNSGNLAPSTVLGNLLILSSMDDLNGDGVVFDFQPPLIINELADDPDDGGTISVVINEDYGAKDLTFDVVDIEPLALVTKGYSVTFLFGGVEIASVDFLEFTTPSSPFYDPTVVWGNNSANRLTIPEGLIGVFDEVRFRMGDEGGIDNLTFTIVPEPGTWTLFGLGALALALARRRGLRQRRVAAAPSNGG